MNSINGADNQPPVLEEYNLYLTDPILDKALAREGGKPSRDALITFGEKVGSAEVIDWGFQANVNEPRLRTHDRFGNRIDQVDFHPAWHSLMDLATTNGLHSLPWEQNPDDNGHIKRSALLYMASQVESGHVCPISMTTSVVPSLRATPGIAEEWIPRITTRAYDSRFVPPEQKSGILMGMGMTEKQGGSDVRANVTTAAPVNGGGPGAEYRVTGHKWFTSAPMSDAFLVLAQAPGGLSCFLLPRWTPDAEVNGFRIQRLKDKLGNRSNASAEVEFDQAYAQLVGEEGRGVPTIIEMVNGTRLDCVMGSAALMRQAVAQAGWHVQHRHAFGSALIDKPLMQNVIADLEVETEVATLMMVRLAGSFDRADSDDQEAAFRRVALPVAKYWVTKQTTAVVREAMECLGGNGYIEESILPRLFRESPVNAIWEGSGNVIALDLLRVLNREPRAFDAFFVEMEGLAAVNQGLSSALAGIKDRLATLENPEAPARIVVEDLAKIWGACLAYAHEDDVLAETFMTSRVQGHHGFQYGTLGVEAPIDELARRAVPWI